MQLQHLKIATIVFPALALAAAGYLILFPVHELVATPGGFVALLVLGSVAVFAFSTVAFRIIGRMESQLLEQNRQLSALARVASAAAENADLQQLLDIALDYVLEVTGTEAGVICLLDADAEELVSACYRGFSDELAAQVRRQKLGEEPVGTEVVRTGKPVVVEEIFADPKTREALNREGFHAAVSIPLKAENEVSGVLAIATGRRSTFSAHEVALLSNIGTQLGLAVRNSLLLAKTQQRNKELAALVQVGRATSSSIRLGSLLEEALDAILSVTSAERAEVWLVAEDGSLDEACARGAPTGDLAGTRHLQRGEGLAGRVAATGEPIATHANAGDSETPDSLGDGAFQTYVGLPLRQNGKILGVLGVAAREKDALSGALERRLLEAIGDRLAMAVDNAELHRRVLDVAVVRERERIARELHDGLAQVLGYIITQTLAVKALLSGQRLQEADRQLSTMEDAARKVYADVREAILGLSTQIEVPGGLVASLESYITHFSRMTGLDVSFEKPLVGLEAIGSTAEIQLLRIVQEALSNCRKHANATHVSVLLSRQAADLFVEITDDGRGFDAESVTRDGWPQFGIQSMRERAQAIGGVLQVDSAPGRGTRLSVRIPVAASAGLELSRAHPAR